MSIETSFVRNKSDEIYLSPEGENGDKKRKTKIGNIIRVIILILVMFITIGCTSLKTEPGVVICTSHFETKTGRISTQNSQYYWIVDKYGTVYQVDRYKCVNSRFN